MNHMANLGYVGLGGMGSRMAARLMDKGHTITGYNRTRAKAQALIDQGMAWADSPKAVAQATDSIFVNVADSDSLEAVADRVDSALQDKPEREMSTEEVGAFVMNELRHLDTVAYVRFASVYRHFRDIGEFMTELKDLLNAKE